MMVFCWLVGRCIYRREAGLAAGAGGACSTAGGLGANGFNSAAPSGFTLV